MSLSIAFDLDDSGCAAHHSQLVRVALFTGSFHPLGPEQYYFNEAYCCPLCGKLWGRKYYVGAPAGATRWTFEPRECGKHLMDSEEFDYFLLCSQDAFTPFNPDEAKALINEYARCYEFYRSGRPYRYTHYGSAARVPPTNNL
jgi:hypothetical protein